MNDFNFEAEKEKQLEIIGTMSTAFKRFLIEHMGPIENKPIVELMGWCKALYEVELQWREYLRKELDKKELE